MEELTDRQQEVLNLILERTHRGKPFPSLRSLAKQLGLASPRGVAIHLEALERKGYLSRQQPRQSAYTVDTEESADHPDIAGLDIHSFPYAGGLAAGTPKPAFDLAERISFNTHYFGGGEQFAVCISGDSMSGDGIHDGDIAIIRNQPGDGPQRKDIVAIRVGSDDMTLKRLDKQGDHVRLVSSNPSYTDRIVPANQIEVVGKLVGVVRRI